MLPEKFEFIKKNVIYKKKSVIIKNLELSQK